MFDISNPIRDRAPSSDQGMESTWLVRELGDEEVSGGDRDGKLLAVLSTYHRGRGVYVSIVRSQSEWRTDSGFIVTRFAIFGGRTLFQTQHGARFSRKALASVHETALGVLTDELKYGNEELAPYFDPERASVLA